MVNIIIFSKDRACQLDCLLRSIIRYMYVPHTIYILYTYTTEEYEKGYNKLIEKCGSTIKFIKEKDFCNDFKTILNYSIYEFTILFVDDTLLIRPIVKDSVFNRFIHNDNILSVSLRLCKNSKYTHFNTIEKEIPLPIFIDDSMYLWENSGTPETPHWEHPITANGQIVRTKVLQHIVSDSQFSNPNMLERVLIKNIPNIEYALCYNDLRVAEFAINIVNTTHTTNIHGDVNIEYLNDMWLKDYEIDIDYWCKIVYSNPEYQRFMVEPTFSKRLIQK